MCAHPSSKVRLLCKLFNFIESYGEMRVIHFDKLDFVKMFVGHQITFPWLEGLVPSDAWPTQTEMATETRLPGSLGI